MTETTIDPRPDQLRDLVGAAAPGPIVMLNLLRFKDTADGVDARDGISGAEAYRRYGEAVAPLLAAAGGRILLIAACAESVIGPREEAWDMLVLAEYPSRQAFLDMIARPEFQADHAHRAAALADSRLVCCEQLPLHG